MIELGITSYLFGKSADFVYDLFYEKLDVRERSNRKKLTKFIEDFKSEILQRHKENPDFEQIENFWKEYNVVGELFAICYLRTSKFGDYQQFMNSLKLVDYNMNHELCFSLIDQFVNQLIDTIEGISSFTGADIATINNLLKQSMDGSVVQEQDNLDSPKEISKDSEKHINIIIDYEDNIPYISNKEELSMWVNHFISKTLETLDFKIIDNKVKTLNLEIEELSKDNNNNKIIGKLKEQKYILDSNKVVRDCIIQYYSNSELSFELFEVTDFNEFEEMLINLIFLSRFIDPIKEGQRFITLPCDENDIYGCQIYLTLKSDTVDYLHKTFSEKMSWFQMGSSAQGVGLFVSSLLEHEKINILANFIYFFVTRISVDNLDKKYYILGNYVISPS